MVDRLFGSVHQNMFRDDQGLLDRERCVVEGPAQYCLDELEDPVARHVVVRQGSDLVEFAAVTEWQSMEPKLMGNMQSILLEFISRYSTEQDGIGQLNITYKVDKT